MFLDRALPQYSPDELAERAEHAKRLLRDPFFLSIIEEAESGAISEWLRNTDPAARERCWLLAKGIDTVLITLQAAVGMGPMKVDSTERGA